MTKYYEKTIYVLTIFYILFSSVIWEYLKISYFGNVLIKNIFHKNEDIKTIAKMKLIQNGKNARKLILRNKVLSKEHVDILNEIEV